MDRITLICYRCGAELKEIDIAELEGIEHPCVEVPLCDLCMEAEYEHGAYDATHP